MDDNQDVGQMPEQVEPEKTPEVGFPMAQPKPKGKINKLVIFGLLVLLLVGGAVFLFTRSSRENDEGISPSPAVEGLSGPTASPTQTPTPSPVDKSDVSIEIQNGTGIAGEAAYLQGQLKSLGFSDIKVGNAEDDNYQTTTVTFARSLSSTVVDEITKKLESIYQKVEVKTSSTQKADALIIVGLREGATPKPTATATPTSTPTATSTATPNSD